MRCYSEGDSVRDSLRAFTNVRISISTSLYSLTSCKLCRGGMIAPILGGVLLVADRSLPVYTSVVIFALAGVCTLLLSEDEGRSGRGRAAVAH